MAPIAYAEALTCRKNGRFISGCASVGPFMTAKINVLRAVLHSEVQLKGLFFLVRAVRGHAMLA